MELVFESSAPRLFQTMPAHGPGSARPPGVRGISATKVRGSRAGRAIGRASARQASNKRDHDRGASISRSAFEARALAAHFRERARAHQHRIAIDKNVAAPPSRALQSSRFAMRSTSSRPFPASNPTLCSRSEPSWMTSEAFARRPDQGRPVEHGEHGHLRRARPPLSRRSRHFDQEGPSYLGIPHGLMSQVLTFGASKSIMMVQTLRFSDHRDSEHFQERDRFTLFPTRAPSRPWRSGARSGVLQGWFGVMAVRALSRPGDRGSERFARGARLSRARLSFSRSFPFRRSPASRVLALTAHAARRLSCPRTRAGALSSARCLAETPARAAPLRGDHPLGVAPANVRGQ